MKRIVLTITAIFLTWTAYADPALSINIVGVSPGSTLTPISASEGMKLENPLWCKNESHRQRRLWAYSPEIKDNQWRKFEIRFKLDRSQPVHITFERQKLGKDEKFPILSLRNLSAKGFPLQAAAWKSSKKQPRPVDAEKGTLLIPSGMNILQIVNIPRDAEMVLSGEYRFTDNSSVKPEIPPLSFETGKWKLVLDSETGAWQTFSFNGKELFSGGQAPFDLKVGKSLVSAGVDTRLSGKKFDAKKGTLELKYDAHEWQFFDSYEFSQNEPYRVKRQMSFQYTGNQKDLMFHELKYRYLLPGKGDYLFPGVFFNSPEGIWSGKHDYSAAGNPMVARGKIENIYNNMRLWAAHYVGVILVKPEGAPVILWGRKPEHESGNYMLSRSGKKAEVVVTIACSGWAENGKIHKLDPVFWEVCNAPNVDEALRRDVPEFYRATGQTGPADRPENVYDALIFGSWFPRFQLASLESFRLHEISRIKDMGFNTFYIPPIQIGGVSYAPVDFLTIDREHGTWEEYKALVRDLRKNGITLMQDIVPHGAYVTEIEDRLFNRHGMVMRGRAADFYSASWNRKMGEYTRFYSRMGAGSYRVDAVSASSTPNWRKKGVGIPRSFPYEDRLKDNPSGDPLPEGVWENYLKKNGGEVPALEYDRASMAGLAGGRRMAQTIRNAARDVNMGYTLLETHGYPYTRFGDICYDVLMRKLPYKYELTPAAAIAQEIARYLTESRLADVPGALYLRNILMNDDRIAMRVGGFIPGRPMDALLYFSEGVPLIYSDGMYGNYKFIQRLNALRNHHPALRRGIPEYTANGELLLIERTLPDETVLGVLNFSANPQTRTLRLPPFLANAPALIDGMTGKELMRLKNSVEITVPPYGTMLLASGIPNKENNAPQSVKTVSMKKPHFQGNRVEGENYCFTFDPVSGLPSGIVTKNGKKLTGKCELLTAPGFPLPSTAKVEVQQLPDAIRIVAKAGNCSWTWVCHADRITVSLDLPPGYRLLIPTETMEDIQLRMAGGLWEEHISPAYASAKIWKPDYSRGESFYRPEDFALLADSTSTQPDLSSPELRMSQGDSSSLWKFVPGNSPAFRIYRQFNRTPGIHLLFAGTGTFAWRANTPQLNPEPSITPWIAGELRVTDCGNEYLVENRHYRLRISRRGGMIREFRSIKENRVLTTDAEAFLLDKKSGRLLHNGIDYESRVFWKKTAQGIQLRVESELRRDYKQSEAFPLSCVTEYRFDDSPHFSANYEICAATLAIPKADLGIRCRLDKQEKEFPIIQNQLFLPKRDCRITLRWNSESGTEPITLVSKEVAKIREAVEPDDFSALMKWTTLSGAIKQHVHDILPKGSGVRTFYRTFPDVLNGENVCEMRFPDPALQRTLSPSELPAKSKWRLSLMRSSRDLANEKSGFRESAWTPGWDKEADRPAPVTISLEYITGNGEKKTVRKICNWSGTVSKAIETLEFEVPETGMAPVMRIQCKMKPESRLVIHSTRLERLP